MSKHKQFTESLYVLILRHETALKKDLSQNLTLMASRWQDCVVLPRLDSVPREHSLLDWLVKHVTSLLLVAADWQETYVCELNLVTNTWAATDPMCFFCSAFCGGNKVKTHCQGSLHVKYAGKQRIKAKVSFCIYTARKKWHRVIFNFCNHGFREKNLHLQHHEASRG